MYSEGKKKIFPINLHHENEIELFSGDTTGLDAKDLAALRQNLRGGDHTDNLHSTTTSPSAKPQGVTDTNTAQLLFISGDTTGLDAKDLAALRQNLRGGDHSDNLHSSSTNTSPSDNPQGVTDTNTAQLLFISGDTTGLDAKDLAALRQNLRGGGHPDNLHSSTTTSPSDNPQGVTDTALLFISGDTTGLDAKDLAALRQNLRGGGHPDNLHSSSTSPSDKPQGVTDTAQSTHTTVPKSHDPRDNKPSGKQGNLSANQSSGNKAASNETSGDKKALSNENSAKGNAAQLDVSDDQVKPEIAEVPLVASLPDGDAKVPSISGKPQDSDDVTTTSGKPQDVPDDVTLDSSGEESLLDTSVTSTTGGASFFKRKIMSPSPAMKYRIMCQCGAANCRKFLF